MHHINDKPLRVLLVEDNHDDALLTTEILRLSSIPNEVRLACTATEALSYLYAYRSSLLHSPQIILLDLQLPDVSGCEMLVELKTDPDMWHIPVCILTSSDNPKDVRVSRILRAYEYFRKPLDLEHFEAAVQILLF
jgi:CheY-like chemotaxis protein